MGGRSQAACYSSGLLTEDGLGPLQRRGKPALVKSFVASIGRHLQ